MKPFVSEDDPTITARYVDLERDGASMRAYAAWPPAARQDAPSIVIAMHLSGVDAGLRDIARRFATVGFATVVPDLYARFGAPDGDAVDDIRQFLPIATRLSKGTVEPDILTAAAWLRERFPATKTAIAGFCMGGVIALHRCAGYASVFSAGAIWYGSIARANVDPASVDIPIVASFGADDRGIPVAEVEAFARSLQLRNDIVIYPSAGHAFFDHQRATYEPIAAEDSWRRTIAFLHDALV